MVEKKLRAIKKKIIRIKKIYDKNIKLAQENKGQFFNRLTTLNKKKLLCKSDFQVKKQKRRNHILNLNVYAKCLP